MKRLSIDNGLTYMDFNNLTEENVLEIYRLWPQIENNMDAETREKVHYELRNVNILCNIQFLKEYLKIAKHDLVIG